MAVIQRVGSPAKKNLIRVYTGATSEKRIDIIIKNYTKFVGIVDGYTDGLRYMIECEKESSHRQSVWDSGNRKGDIYQVSAERKDNFGYCRGSRNDL